MIKAIGRRFDGKLCLIIAISEENIERLKDDKPIHFYAQQMKMDKIQVDEVLLAYFETEEKAVEHFIRVGLITRDQLINGRMPIM